MSAEKEVMNEPAEVPIKIPCELYSAALSVYGVRGCIYCTHVLEKMEHEKQRAADSPSFLSSVKLVSRNYES